MKILTILLLIFLLSSVLFGMATGVLTIPKSFTINVRDYIIETHREGYPSGLIPVDDDVEGEPYTHRIPYMGEQDVSKSGVDWDPTQALAEAKLNYADCSLFVQQINLGFRSRDFRHTKKLELNAKVREIIDKFLDEIDHDIFHGKTEGNVTLQTGLLAQATSVVDLDGTDSALVDAASLLAGLKKMVTTIPVKYRSKYPIVMIMDHTLAETCATTFIGDSSVSVLQAFQNAFPYVTIERNNSAVLTSGTDTAGTHSRVLVFPQSTKILQRVIAKPVSPVGPALVDLTGGVQQLWGTLFGIKVVFSDAVLYSEQIVYA